MNVAQMSFIAKDRFLYADFAASSAGFPESPGEEHPSRTREAWDQPDEASRKSRVVGELYE
jgi:hypothetical protein